MEYTPKDEIKVIIALGIDAGILVYLQIIGSGGTVVPTSVNMPTPLGFIVGLFVYAELFLFGTYVLLLTLALGYDALGWSENGSIMAMRFADILFGFGAVVIYPLVIFGWAYLFVKAEQSTGANFVFDLALVAATVVIILAAIASYNSRFVRSTQANSR